MSYSLILYFKCSERLANYIEDITRTWILYSEQQDYDDSEGLGSVLGCKDFDSNCYGNGSDFKGYVRSIFSRFMICIHEKDLYRNIFAVGL